MKMAPHLVLFDGVVDYIDFFHVGLGEGEKIRMSLRGRVGGAVVLIGKRDDLNEVIKLHGFPRAERRYIYAPAALAAGDLKAFYQTSGTVISTSWPSFADLQIPSIIAWL